MTLTTANGLAGTIEVRHSGHYSTLLTTVQSYIGTTEYVECSNRGVCLNDTG